MTGRPELCRDLEASVVFDPDLGVQYASPLAGVLQLVVRHLRADALAAVNDDPLVLPQFGDAGGEFRLRNQHGAACFWPTKTSLKAQAMGRRSRPPNPIAGWPPAIPMA